MINVAIVAVTVAQLLAKCRPTSAPSRLVSGRHGDRRHVHGGQPRPPFDVQQFAARGGQCGGERAADQKADQTLLQLGAYVPGVGQ